MVETSFSSQKFFVLPAHEVAEMNFHGFWAFFPPLHEVEAERCWWIGACIQFVYGRTGVMKNFGGKSLIPSHHEVVAARFMNAKWLFWATVSYRHLEERNYIKGTIQWSLGLTSLLQLCFPPLCAGNSPPYPTKRSSNVKMSLSCTLCENEIPKFVLVDMIWCKLLVCEANTIFTGKNSIAQECNKRDIEKNDVTAGRGRSVFNAI